MTVTRYIGVSLSLAVTLCLGAAAAEPNAGASAGSGDGANVVPPAAAKTPGQATAAVADSDEKPLRECPAWDDFVKLAGDTAASRRLFADMLKDAPEVLASVGRGPKEAGHLLEERVPIWFEQARRKPHSVTLPGNLAVVLVAGRKDVRQEYASPSLDGKIADLLLVGPTEWDRNSPRLPWEHPDERLTAAKRVLSRWASAESGPRWIIARMAVSRWFALDDAKTPLLLQLARNRDTTMWEGCRELAYAEAIVVAGSMGEKDLRSSLAQYLEDAGPLDVPRRLGFYPQRRDLALAAIVQLSGQKPEDYHFGPARRMRVMYANGPLSYRVFEHVQDRNEGFALCIKNFKSLGLGAPPRYTPETPPIFCFAESSTFVPSPAEQGIPPALAKRPDGDVTLQIQGNTARLVNVATGKPIGQPLSAGSWFEDKDPEFKFTCFSFSHNGKYVVTGSSFHLPSESRFNLPTSVGHLEVWDSATGKRVEDNPLPTGRVRSVNFSGDDRSIYYDAERFHRENS